MKTGNASQLSKLMREFPYSRWTNVVRGRHWTVVAIWTPWWKR